MGGQYKTMSGDGKMTAAVGLVVMMIGAVSGHFLPKKLSFGAKLYRIRIHRIRRSQIRFFYLKDPKRSKMIQKDAKRLKNRIFGSFYDSFQFCLKEA